MSAEEHNARIAAHLGIPLATAGDVGYTMGGTRWIRIGAHWWYQGMEPHPAYCEGRNVVLVAERERGMTREEFAGLWRRLVEDMLRAGARCVRVRVIGG